jgi:hypothetical protein
LYQKVVLVSLRGIGALILINKAVSVALPEYVDEYGLGNPYRPAIVIKSMLS